MQNKHVGYLLLGISLVIFGIIFLFNKAMKKIIIDGCPVEHSGYTCPAFDTISQQTYLSIFIVSIIVIIGFILIFSKPESKTIVKKIHIREKRKKIDFSDFNSDEKKILNLIEKNKAMFQADLIDASGFNKTKITRILDKFEARGIIERKRRGMNNIIVLNYN